MKKGLILFISIFLLAGVSAFAQDEDKKKGKNNNDQEALDESMVSPEQKKQLDKAIQAQKKAKKKRDAKDKITRNRAAKITNARLKKAGSKTKKKKKKYVKTHN